MKFHQNLSYSAYSKEFRELTGYVCSNITELQVQNPGHFNPTNTGKYLFSISIHHKIGFEILKWEFWSTYPDWTGRYVLSEYLCRYGRGLPGGIQLPTGKNHLKGCKQWSVKGLKKTRLWVKMLGDKLDKILPSSTSATISTWVEIGVFFYPTTHTPQTSTATSSSNLNLSLARLLSPSLNFKIIFQTLQLES